MNKKRFLLLALLTLSSSLFTLHSSLVHAQDTTAPGARWWWLGSAVDKENLRWNMEQYAVMALEPLRLRRSLVSRAIAPTISSISRLSGWRCCVMLRTRASVSASR